MRCFRWCLRFQNPTVLGIQYHQVPTATAFYWPSTIIYQPVPLHTDPVPPSINLYQPILLLLGDNRLLYSLPRVLFAFLLVSISYGFLLLNSISLSISFYFFLIYRIGEYSRKWIWFRQAIIWGLPKCNRFCYACFAQKSISTGPWRACFKQDRLWFSLSPIFMASSFLTAPCALHAPLRRGSANADSHISRISKSRSWQHLFMQSSSAVSTSLSWVIWSKRYTVPH